MKRQPKTEHLTWFLDMNQTKQLNLNPPYQRKSIWTPKDRRFFLDTIFRNYPTPPIFLHRETDDNGRTTYHVVDGKQRLETIFLFADNKIAIDKEFGDVNYNGKKFKNLSTDAKRAFWDYVLVVDYLESVEGTLIEEVFNRVNRNAKNLQAQELRHARYDGWFIKEVEEESEDIFWAEIYVSTKAKSKRMKDVQLISELALIILEGEIKGFDQDYLDEMYGKYDEPEETAKEFDRGSYKTTLAFVKKTIRQMNKTNKCIDKYCRTANNLYTLWALITLSKKKLPSAAVLAKRYLAFMNRVQVFIDAETPQHNKPTAPVKNQFKYYINSIGAATELQQRVNRLSSLMTILK
jgi:hypothetical protein